MAAKNLPPVSLLRQIFRYDPENGVLYHASRPLWMFKSERYSRAWHSKYSGRPISSDQGRDYAVACIMGESHHVSRIAYKMHHGIEPPAVVDHINGNKRDNRIENLRGATVSQNLMNRPHQRNNSTGYKGVFRSKRPGHFVAQICKDGKVLCLGTYQTAKSAHDAYKAAASRLHGEFANP